MIVTVTATSMDKDKAEILCEFDAEVDELSATMRVYLVESLSSAINGIRSDSPDEDERRHFSFPADDQEEEKEPTHISGPPRGLTSRRFLPED